MRRADLVRLTGIYAAALVGGTLLWVILFHSPLLAGWVFFYRGIALLVMTSVLLAGLLLAYRRTRHNRGLVGIRDILLVTTLLLSVNVVFFTHLPVTADRSISVFMLAYMDGTPGSLTEAQVADAVVRVYVEDRDAIGKRLDEQQVTGTLTRVGDGYVLSGEGRTLVAFYRAIAVLFNINPVNLARP